MKNQLTLYIKKNLVLKQLGDESRARRGSTLPVLSVVLEVLFWVIVIQTICKIEQGKEYKVYVKDKC